MGVLKMSLRLKVIMAFLIVVVPILCLTVYISIYGISVVRTQVAYSNQNLVKMYANQLDRTIEEVNSYLNKLSSGEPDLRALNLYSLDSPDYILAKYNITNKLNLDREYFNKVNSFFVLRDNPFDVIETNHQINIDKRNQQHVFLKGLLNDSTSSSKWQVYLYDNSQVLIKIQKLNNNVYVGAWIQLDNMKIPMDLLNLGDSGRAMLLSYNNQIVTDITVSDRQVQKYLYPVENIYSSPDWPYRIWQDDSGRKYMLVSNDLKYANLKLAVAVLEEDMLAHLPNIQKFIFILPIVIVVILLLYLLFFKKYLLHPLYALVKGMKEVSRGNLQVRVETGRYGELDFLIQSFHDMVDKIKTLQIDVYEEKLRVQQAEMKQLQLQIQPHFYLNCLNIIHSLADLRNFEQIRNMSQYLSDYFRFSLYYVESVSLTQELKHIRNYLEIQRIRYPDRLVYEIMADEEPIQFQIPPLLILPFIENSVKHGMKSDASLYLLINIKLTGPEQRLEIILQDNGCGFSETFLSRWLLSEYDPQHMGIWNVRQRIRVYFGEQSRLKICNLPSGGAQIQMQLSISNDAQYNL
jgi:two-component system sensor histidine kinase YesM